MARIFSFTFFLLAASLHGELPPAVVRLVEGATAQIGQTVRYDPAYVRLAYPLGDVPVDRGVCTDVVIRAFRRIGIDLQKEVHEDMQRGFDAYPQIWGLRAPDKNIDHRRVPNLMCFFARRGKALAVTRADADYRPGDIVAWRLPDGRPHIGLVANASALPSARLLIIHNIGTGAKAEDRLFDFQIIGHYRYF